MKGEVLEIPYNRHTNKPIGEAELQYEVKDKFLGAKTKGINQYSYYGKFIKLGKKRLSKSPDKMEKSILNLSAKYMELFKTPKIGDTQEDQNWINDEIIKDWERESNARLIIGDEGIPFYDDSEIDFVDDPEPTDSELEQIIGSSDYVNQDFPGGKEAQKQLKPDH